MKEILRKSITFIFSKKQKKKKDGQTKEYT